MSRYDLIGNIAIVKFGREEKMRDKKKWAIVFLKEHKNVRTIVEKVGKFKGRLRTQKTKHLMGDKGKEAIYKENGCLFRLNVDTCYFSPRLASERLEIAKLTKKGEKVLVMFGGVAPFAVVIAKFGKAGRVVSVELGRECNKYALENVKRNKLEGKVEVVQGDVRKVVPKMREKFDRIVMARPNLEDMFLDVAFSCVKKKGIIHYYGFCSEQEIDAMKEMILHEVKKAKKKIKILRVKKTGDIGVRTFRWRWDTRIEQ